MDAQVTNHRSQFNYGGVVNPSPRPRPLSQFNYGGVAIPPPAIPPPPLYGMPIRFGLSIPHFGHSVPSIAPGSFGGISYGPRPTINAYGYGIQGPPHSAAARITDNSASKKHRHNGI
ncbi:hypothetical protein TSUD_352600 [Trifolium subterraneum]|nr:hypothetical protein TSUD_352600 [Trifolium subterraneum]